MLKQATRRSPPPAAQPAPARDEPDAATPRASAWSWVLQPKRTSGAAPEVSPQTASRIANFHGDGEALSPAAKAYFEPQSASPGPGADVVRRTITDPPRPFDDKPRPPRFSLGAELILERLDDFITTVETSPLPYTQGTRIALLRVRRSIYDNLRKLEKLRLSRAAKARLRTITEVFVDKLEDEVARSPEKDPYQEGNILGIERRWYRAFKDRLETEQALEKVKELREKLKEQPGDYPLPDNPLDLPKQEDSGQRLA